MSTFLEPTIAPSSSQVLDCIKVDGKPTRLSNRHTATATSSVAVWAGQLARFNRGASSIVCRIQFWHCAALCDYPVWTESTIFKLPNGTAIRVLGGPANKLLSLHELPSVARYMPLTKAVSTRYAGVQAGGLRCGDSAAYASGSVPGALDNQGKEARS